MKKVLFSFLLVLSATVNAQEDTTANEFSDSTGFGTPDGKLISRKIGAAGGNITSEDGRIELIFPAGALLSNTEISIQPTTNPLFGGAGKAYRCEPSGTQFKKPVQIIFHYSEEEAKTCPPDLMNIAMQDHSGKWSFANYEKWDSTAKALYGFIHHFSWVTNNNKAKIVPDKKAVRVNESVDIKFYDNYGTLQSGPFAGSSKRLKMGDRYWAVNGIKYGDDKVGYVRPPGASSAMGVYTAPNVLPRQNPVIVNFYFEYYSEILEKDIWGIVSCEILISDRYQVQVNFLTPRNSEPKIADSAIFSVDIKGGKIEVSGLQNFRPKVGEMRKPYKCEYKIYTDGCEGPIEITAGELQNYSITNDDPPKVIFDLPKEKKVLWYRFQLFCNLPGVKPSGVIDQAQDSPITEINFVADGKDQVIEHSELLPGSDLFYKIIVSRKK